MRPRGGDLVHRLLLVGSQALRHNEESEFGYEASGKPPVVSPMELENETTADR